MLLLVPHWDPQESELPARDQDRRRLYTVNDDVLNCDASKICADSAVTCFSAGKELSFNIP
jgi:hypothetical protein